MSGRHRLSGYAAPQPPVETVIVPRTETAILASSVRRTKARWKLRFPTAVNTPSPVLRDTVVLLAPRRRSKPPKFPGIGKPAVVGTLVSVYTDTIVVSLAPQKRGKTKPSLLRPPTAVATPAAVLRDIVVVLAPQARGKTKPSVLRPPTVVTAATPSVMYANVITVSLAPQRRGKAGSFLVPPQAIVVYPAFGDTMVILAPQRRGKATPVLIRPIVVFGPPPALGWIAASLAPRRRQPIGRSKLRPPTVVN